MKVMPALPTGKVEGPAPPAVPAAPAALKMAISSTAAWTTTNEAVEMIH